MKYVFSFLAWAFGLLGFAATYTDITADDRQWHLIGEFWFTWSPTSLQIAEAVVSRYLDPCGAIVALECEPFLWHPTISTVLGWYAAPIFLLLGLGFALLGRYLGKHKSA
jgi:hypothetical protein